MQKMITAFGQTIRELRKEAKLTQEQLGFEADLQRIYISKLELGQQQPSLATLFKLAQGLNCPAWQIVQRTEQKATILRNQTVSQSS